MIKRSNPRKANLRTGLQAILLTGLAASVMSLFTLPTVSVSQTGSDAGNNTETEEADEEDRYDFGGAEIVADQPAMNNYEGSPKQVDIQKIRESKDAVHFEIDFGGHSNRQKCGWFMFRVDDAGGKKVRIDLTHIGRYDNWKTLNPVFAQIPNLSDPKYFRSAAPEDGYKYVKARNGSKFPWTKGYQRWHYIRNVETQDKSKTLILRQKLSKDRAFIAMRPPYTNGLHKNYMEKFDKLKDVRVHSAGKSEGGHPLNIVQIGGLTEKSAQKNPCVVVYAREHPDEHDTSHLITGLIKWLASDNEEAEYLRSNITFLLIPLLSPDGVNHSMYEGEVWNAFNNGMSLAGPVNFEIRNSRPWDSSVTARKFGIWFRKWANKGHRLDLS